MSVTDVSLNRSNQFSSNGELLLSRIEQNLDQLMERRVGSFVHFFDLHRSDRMLHDEYGMIRRTEGFLLGFRQRVEGMGNQRNRKAAALLNLD